ncbi:MAG: polysaccharide biosynthesis protein [Nocardioides sp.]|uniref:polysaccharide biosynthesis protein n=1 Tax=Nocardioides sp. TaxID=35761 RepID=UPI003F0F34F6
MLQRAARGALALTMLVIAAILLQSGAPVATGVVGSAAHVLQELGVPLWASSQRRVEFVLNVGMFAVPAALGVIGFPRHPWANWVVYGFGVSVVAELLQLEVVPGRSAQFEDVVANTGGALLGVGTGVLLRRWAGRYQERDKGRATPKLWNPQQKSGGRGMLGWLFGEHGHGGSMSEADVSGGRDRWFANLVRSRRVWVMAAFDAAAIAVAYSGFALARYAEIEISWFRAVLVVLAVIATHVGLGIWLKVYRGRWEVGSSAETLALACMSLAGLAVAELVTFFGFAQGLSRSVPVAAALGSFALMMLARAQWRVYVRGFDYVASEDARRTLVVGADKRARQLVLTMRTDATSPYEPVGMVDDDPWRRHLSDHGVRVLGTTSDLARVCEQHDVEVVVVADSGIGKEALGEVSRQAAELGVPVKVLPRVGELLDSRVTIRDVRDINMADLLGRGQVDTDLDAISHFLTGKKVLVTGAGGSIGSELCRQLSGWDIAELMMLDRDESALHGVQLSISGHGLLDTKDVILCDIRDADALLEIFEDRRPDVVFHAAALKHLPMLQQYPAEAHKTNVLGTINVLAAANAIDVEHFVNISTDKAADPTSVLGLSKRVAERATADVATNATGSYISVRFGNVLGSRGSVLTAWTSQIAAGGPVTVTHPDMTRYFMTIAEACQLVLQAGAIGRDGEVLILDMGQPMRIDDVAKQLIAQSGQQIDIVYTGLREGEKLDEILIAGGEADSRPFHPLITHVDVPPLSPEVPMSLTEPTSKEHMVNVLRDWVHLPHHAQVPQ